MEAIIERTPVVIAAEIRSLQDQAKSMALYHAVEIGRRLIEVKELVIHGSWGVWLEDNVSYSARTAQNLMRLAEEYGGGAGLLADSGNTQAFANLDTTKALALLALPAEQREAFLEEHDVAEMSSRKLQEAIRTRDEAVAERDAARERAEESARQIEEAKKQAAALADEKEVASREVNRLKGLLASAKNKTAAAPNDKEVKELTAKLETAERQVKELAEALNKASEPIVVETIPEDVKKELEALKVKAKGLEDKLIKADLPAVKYGIHFDQLKEAFRLLLGDVAEMSGSTDTQGKYRTALIKTVETMRQQL